MISKALKIAAAGLALMVLAGQAAASERLAVARNGMVRVALPASAGSVIVANPNIADVNVVDSHTVYIVGRGYGSSAVTILDRAGRPIFDGDVFVTAGQHSAVTLYKGATPSMLVCSDVCEPATEDTAKDPLSNFLKSLAHPGAGEIAPASATPATPKTPETATSTPAASMARTQ